MVKKIVALILALLLSMSFSVAALATSDNAVSPKSSSGSIDFSGLTISGYGTSSKRNIGACAVYSSLVCLISESDDKAWDAYVWNNSTFMKQLGRSSGISQSYSINTAGTYYVQLKNEYSTPFYTISPSYVSYYKA